MASPGTIRGNVTVVNTLNLDAPNDLEASSTEGSITGYRFYVRADGYAPNRAILYPEGRDGPAVEIGRTRRMLYDAPKSAHKDVPTYFYTKPGSYRPTIVLVNDAGWRPDGKTIDSGLVEMARPIVVPQLCEPGRIPEANS